MTGRASFPNAYIASPTSQLILQPFRRFTYVTAHSKTLPFFHLCHRHFTYLTWQAAHDARIHISAATELERDTVPSPTLDRLYSPGKPLYLFDKADRTPGPVWTRSNEGKSPPPPTLGIGLWPSKYKF